MAAVASSSPIFLLFTHRNQCMYASSFSKTKGETKIRLENEKELLAGKTAVLLLAGGDQEIEEIQEKVIKVYDVVIGFRPPLEYKKDLENPLLQDLLLLKSHRVKELHVIAHNKKSCEQFFEVLKNKMIAKGDIQSATLFSE